MKLTGDASTSRTLDATHGNVHLQINDGIAAVVFDRPEAHNAMTWWMYECLEKICETISRDASIRVVTFRGAGGKAFVAGTDIEQFLAFEGGDDGVEYEKTIEACVSKIERLTVPTIALVQGWAIGGGLAIAAACDFRLATPESAFGAPIARTLGNCLSIANMSRVVNGFGMARAKKMLMLAQNIGAQEAHDCGFVTALAQADAFDEAASALCNRLMTHAPLTMRAAKEAIRRIGAATLSADEDLVRLCYGSEDFRIGMHAFLEKTRPQWTGR